MLFLLDSLKPVAQATVERNSVEVAAAVKALVAAAISAQAPLAVVATRLNVLKAVEHGPLVAMHDFMDVQQRLSNSADASEGLASFVEKRDARFSGR